MNVCDVLYAVLYVRVTVRRYINVCNCDVFNVVNVYLDHLKYCVVCIDGRRYNGCSECKVVSNECNEHTSCLVQPISTRSSEVMSFWCVCFRYQHYLCYMQQMCTPAVHLARI